MAFDNATRRKTAALGALAKGASNPLQWDIPKVGLLGGIMLTIRGTVAGSLSAPNALGMSSIIRSVRLVTNGGIDLINISGAQYWWMLKDYILDYKNPGVHGNGRAAVTATTFILDMYLPTRINSRDPVGLFMLQNEQTLVQLQVEFETDSVVATGATVTATVTPYVEYFTLPLRREDWPRLDVVRQILGDTRSIAATGDYDYYVPRGNTYTHILHAIDPGPAASEEWSKALVLINQSDTLATIVPAVADLEYALTHGVARPTNLIPIDYVGTAGLGTFGSSRDVIYTAQVTEYVHRITFTGTGTLHTVRSQLVNLTSG